MNMATLPGFEGIEVEVISNGNSLPFYDDPDPVENQEPRTRQNYIEAVTGATFIVKVTLSEEFEMGSCDAARIIISFDGEKQRWYGDVSRGDFGLKHRSLRDRQVSFSAIPHFCTSSGQWKSGKLCFGELSTGKFVQRSFG